MKQTILRLSLITFTALTLHASSVEYGNGTISITGGFIGLDESISADISTYTLKEEHKNIFSSTWYYHYNITWYDSDKMVQAQDSINNTIGSTSSVVSGTTGVSSPVIPAIDYRFEGLDLNLALGKDLYHKDENNYFGLGVMVGASLPWIDSQKDSSNDDSTSDDLMDAMKKSKTEMMTYKIGPSISASFSLNQYFIFYGSATYAYQTGTMKNDYANSDLKVDGFFQEYDVGIKIQPFAQNYATSWITLSPRLYATLGYRYTDWLLQDVAIDVTGVGNTFSQTDFESDSSVVYFGIGYSFF